MYKLSDFYKATIDKDKWVKIYEAKFDPNYEKMMNFLLQLVKILIFYKTLVYIKKYIWGGNVKNEKNEKNQKNQKNEKNQQNQKKEQITAFSKKDLSFMFVFYFFTLGFYFINLGFFKRNVHRILVKNSHARLFYKNSNDSNREYVEIPIEKMTSITSKSKTMHEVFYVNEKNKVCQFFLYKNAFYDKNFLVNLCHPKVKKVKFTNVNLQ